MNTVNSKHKLLLNSNGNFDFFLVSLAFLSGSACYALNVTYNFFDLSALSGNENSALFAAILLVAFFLFLAIFSYFALPAVIIASFCAGFVVADLSGTITLGLNFRYCLVVLAVWLCVFAFFAASEQILKLSAAACARVLSDSNVKRLFFKSIFTVIMFSVILPIIIYVGF